MNEQTARLTDMTGSAGATKHPNICQSCGRGDPTKPVGNLKLQRWQEHDHNDQPENRVIVLCEACSKRVIEPHPRLYRSLNPNDPWPGCMAICVDCRLRDGVRYAAPEAKANGGPGVLLRVGEPTRGFVDGRNYSGPMVWWPYPPTACKQKKV